MKVTTLLRDPEAECRRFARFLRGLGYESTNQVRSGLYEVLTLACPDPRPGNAHQRRVALRAETCIYRNSFGAHRIENIASDYPEKFRNEL